MEVVGILTFPTHYFCCTLMYLTRPSPAPQSGITFTHQKELDKKPEPFK